MAEFEDSLSLVQKVLYGIDIGIDTNTAADYLCLVCHKKRQYVTMFEANGTYYCATHHNETGRSYRHKSKFPEYRERYNSELEHRLEETKMVQEPQRDIAVRPHSPIMPTRQEKLEMMDIILKAGLVTSKDFGQYEAMAREYLSVVGLTCGLSPHLGEIMVWPDTRGKGDNKKVVGIVTFVSGYGYLRKANEQAAIGNGYSWAEDDCEILTPEQVLQRRAHICYSCNGSGKFGDTGKCFKCNGAGKFKPEDVLVVKRSLYLDRQAAISMKIGKEPQPIRGYGVIQPGDFNIPSSRDLVSRAELRGLKAVMKLAYSINFYIPTPSEDLLENYVNGVEYSVKDEGDVIEGVATVIEDEPNGGAEQPEVEPEPEESQQPSLITVFQLGFGETIPKSQEGIDMQNDVWSRLADLGYPKGKPQVNLIQALYGNDVNWKTITGGQINNMLVYASRAHDQPQDVKDALKEECRKHTEEGKFWL